jgi:biotin carboxyl carrier protein
MNINSPLPGNIIDVKVKKGDSIKEGQILMIIESMKMQNEIYAENDGLVDEVYVSVNCTVAVEQPLLKII